MLRLAPGKRKAERKPPYEKFTLREPRITPIEAQDDVTRVDVKYPLIEPFAQAHVKWDPAEKKLVYSLIEPAITPAERDMLSRIETGLAETIDVRISAARDTEQIIDYIQERSASIIKELGLSIPPESYSNMMYYIVRDFVGLNEIEPMMHDPYIEDIGCTGVDSHVYIVHKRFGSMETGLVYKDIEQLSNFVIKMSERCGRYISYATPLLDGSLPDGSRVQASLAKDVTTKGPTFSIRRFRKNPFSPVDLMNTGTVSADIMAYLWLLVEYGASLMICGGVSTGKTSLLNVISMFIPREDKIISIEDTREINLPHENWIPSVSRSGFGIPDSSGRRYGEVDLFDLLKESFRQNPDYVIVGEVRGKEAYVLFQGMASGHPSMGTIHAGSIDDVMKRLQSPPIELAPSLIESLDVLIVMVNAKEKGKSARRVKEIVEVQGVDYKSGRAQSRNIFRWIPSQDAFEENCIDSELLQRISFWEGITMKEINTEMDDRRKFLKWMQKNGIVQYDEVCGLVNSYSKDRKKVMEQVQSDKPFRKEADRYGFSAEPGREKPRPSITTAPGPSGAAEAAKQAGPGGAGQEPASGKGKAPGEPGKQGS
jgi:flagellar protein FlaI